MSPFVTRTMRRPFVRIVALFATIIALNTTVSCTKDTGPARVEEPADAPSLDDLPLVNGEGMVQFKDRAFKKALLEAWDSNHDNDISPEEALAADAVEAVGKGIRDITGIEACSNRTDYGTMVPLLKTMQQTHGKKYKSATADAGYERLST